MISYLSNSITFEDTDLICPHDRKLILRTLMRIKEAEKEAMDNKNN